MKSYLALLRGINVGGKRVIRMNELRLLFEHLGFDNIKTYIQSGNIVFSGKESLSNSQLEDSIEKAILEHFGFEVPVIVRSGAEWREIVDNNPYQTNESVDLKALHLTILKNKPVEDAVHALRNIESGADTYTLHGKTLFIKCAGKYHESKLSNTIIEKKLQVTATTRNWKTILKLGEYF